MRQKLLRPLTQLAAVSALVLVVSPGMFAGSPVDPVNKDKQGVALKGYDPVAYFTKSQPQKGSSQFSHQWSGATWWFESAENRDRFAAAPEKFAPQFGGYCAWAVSNGYTANADPEEWKIVNGKLYVNYNKDVRMKWEENAAQRIEAGNKNWPGLHK